MPRVQSTRSAPDAETIMHQQFDPGGARVGEKLPSGFRTWRLAPTTDQSAVSALRRAVEPLLLSSRDEVWAAIEEQLVQLQEWQALLAMLS